MVLRGGRRNTSSRAPVNRFSQPKKSLSSIIRASA
jgi:hypothetical protein